MVDLLFAIGLSVAAFVGFNIGGSSTGVAFGPAVGSEVTTKTAAAALMTAFALLGGWTVGRNVIETMGGEIVPSSQFTLAASVAVLFFVGAALLVSNLFSVPASTSMTAVGAIAGLGLASGTLDFAKMGEIVSWWLLAPILAFWVSAIVGRYLYPYLSVRFSVERSPGPTFQRRRIGPVAVPTGLAEQTSAAEVATSALVVAIGCYMAFSAGASNVANAVAPLVGSGELGTDAGVLLGGGAIGIGAFTIARRTLASVGNDLTDLPLLAALIVEVVAASLITFLSAIGIPASLAVSATMSIVGLGWGRATRTTTVAGAAETAVAGDRSGDDAERTPENPLRIDRRGDDVDPIGEEADLRASDLFDPATTGRFVALWILTPSVSAGASFVLFSLVPLYG